MPVRVTQDELKMIADYIDGDLVRTKDRGRCGGSRWRTGTRIGHTKADGYVMASVNGINYKLHHLVWLWHTGALPKYAIDHIDGNPSNNRIENLREATDAQNIQNQRRPRVTNKLGVQGVCRVGDRYRAAIHKGYEKIHIGYFSSAEEAHQAYLAAKREIHEFNTL